MKRLCLLAVSTLMMTSIFSASAKSELAYGDLYNIEWCPCNSDNYSDGDNVVTMGRTVMCPCDGSHEVIKQKEIAKTQAKSADVTPQKIIVQAPAQVSAPAPIITQKAVQTSAPVVAYQTNKQPQNYQPQNYNQAQNYQPLYYQQNAYQNKNQQNNIYQPRGKRRTVSNRPKLYLGFDYITGKTSVGDGELEFADQLFGDAKVKANLDDVIDDQDSFAFIFGARLNRNFGLEAFYQQSFEDNHFSQIDNETLLDNGLDYTDYHLMNNYTTSFRAYGLDLIGYLPLSAYFDFVGSVGVAHYNFVNDASFGVYYLDKFDNRGSTKTDFDDDGIGIRAGLGIQVNIIENVALRLMYKYIHIGGDIVDNLNEFSCGVRFLF